MKNAKNLNSIKGSFFEMLACFVLFLKGYNILKRNYNAKNTSQIDILAEKNDCIHIVEVKFRKDYSKCLGAISLGQQMRLRMSAYSLSKKYNKSVVVDGVFFTPKYPFFIHKENIL